VQGNDIVAADSSDHVHIGDSTDDANDLKTSHAASTLVSETTNSGLR